MPKIDFNLAQAAKAEFELLPHGDYKVQIIESGIKDTKAGHGCLMRQRPRSLRSATEMAWR